MQKVKVLQKKEKYIYKRSMYNIILANQQDIHWKQYILFSVYIYYVVVHCISSLASIYNLIKVVLLSIKK